MQRIILTGATGIVGLALIEECLKHGTEVFAVVGPDSTHMYRLPKNNLLHIIICDLACLDTIHEDTLPSFDVFYHFGWMGTSKKDRNEPIIQAQNIKYSLEAVRLSARLHCHRFIGAGSQAEYGAHQEDKTGPLSITAPITAYGISKLAAGKLCRLEALKYNIDYAWVRIFSIYGKYETSESMIRTLLPKLQKNEVCHLTEGLQNWDFLCSEDAGKALYMLGNSTRDNNPHYIYCLGSGHARTIRSYVEEMKKILNSSSKLGFGDVPYEHGLALSMCADIESLTKITGWTPQILFREGIKKEVSWIAEGK